jgi:hypothetical protein
MLRSRSCAAHVGFLTKGAVQMEVRQMCFYKKVFCPSHRKSRPATPHAKYEIDHAMIAGDWP